MNDKELREYLTYLIEYSNTIADEYRKIDAATLTMMKRVFEESSIEEMLATLTRLDMEYRIVQNVAASGRRKVNDMIRKLKGELE
jgi:hypothetical protein